MRTLLLSIRPKFAGMILDGTKQVELRRIRPKVTDGDLVVIYASSPVKALIGTFQIGEIVSDSPARLWKKVKRTAGISRTQFDEYYAGASTGVGIICKNPSSLVQPVELKELRVLWADFWPPQSYRYLKHEELCQIGHILPAMNAAPTNTPSLNVSSLAD